jgi:hypothetical protein
MSTHVVQSSASAHVTLRVGQVVTQFHVTRDGLGDPAYLYDSNGYGSQYLVHNLEAFPDALLPEVTRLVRHYQTLYILKGDT